MARSWDIRPSSAQAARTPARPAKAEAARSSRSVEMKRRVAPELHRVPTRRESVRKTSAPAPRTPLKERRRTARKKIVIALGVLLIVVLAIVEVVLWQPFLRVQNVVAEGPETERLKTFTEQELSGARYLVLPKNSIFFIPEKELRAHILKAFPELDAVSIAPSGLTTLTIRGIERASVVWWCGVSAGQPAGKCYEADAQGLIFKEVVFQGDVASSSMLSLYAPLQTEVEATSSYVGNTIKDHASLPSLLQFVKAMRTLGANVVSVSLRGDEADLYTYAGTRITYVIGREKQAADLASSAFSTLNLNDGSLLYVDLRFESKVFFKKQGQ